MAESSIKKNLDSILQQRQKKAAGQQEQRDALAQQWKESRDKLERIYNCFSSLDPEDRSKVFSSEDAACLDGLQKKIVENDAAFQDALEKLNTLAVRYNRPTVNLVVVGAIGAGKSKFLQSASGLDDDCIPSHSGRSCTGVTSIIENVVNEGSGDAETEAIFTFKTKAEALEMMGREISRFAWRLHAEDRITESASFEEGVRNLEALKTFMRSAKRENLKILGDDGTDRAIRPADENDLNDLLELYQERRSNWEPYLSDTDHPKRHGLEALKDGTYKLRDKSKIKEYVSKYNEKQERYYLYPAIKKAVILTTFQNGIDARIRLIDTVGIGDIGIDTEERMMEAVRDEADGVIFILEGTDRAENQALSRDEKLIEKFQEVYNLYSKRESDGGLGENKTRYCMAFVVNNRSKAGANKTYGKDYLEHSIIPSFGYDNQIFGKNGIAYKKAVDVGSPDEVKDMIASLLQQISLHLQEIDSGMERSAEQAAARAQTQDETLWNRLRDIQVDDSSDEKAKSNYISELYENRIGSLKEKLIAYKEEISKRKEEERHTASFLQQSLAAVQKLKSGETLSDFFFAPGAAANLNDMIHYYCVSTSANAYSTEFPNGRLAVLRALQNVIREIGARPLAAQTTSEIEYKHRIASICIDSLELNSKRLGELCLNTEDPHFFENLSKALTAGLTKTEAVRKAFLSMDQFKLDKSNGITKALFNHFAAEHFVDKSYSTPNVWQEPGDTKTDLALQELQGRLEAFIDAVKERTSKEVYISLKDGEEPTSGLVSIDGRMYKRVLLEEAYLVDEEDQMINELENLLHVMEPMHEAAWNKILPSLLKEGLMLDEPGRQEHLAAVADITKNLKTLLEKT